LDPRLVLEARLVFETRLLVEDLQVDTLDEIQNVKLGKKETWLSGNIRITAIYGLPKGV